MRYMPENVLVEFHILGEPLDREKVSFLPGKIFYYPLETSRIPVIKRRKLYINFANKFIEKNQNIDLDSTIIVYSSPPTVLAPVLAIMYKKGFKTVFDIRDIYQEWTYYSLLRRILKAREQKIAMKYANIIIYAHPNFVTYLQKDVKDKNKLIYISNGADSNIFNPNGMKAKLDPTDYIHIVYAGGIDKYHGTKVWIDAFSKVSSNNVRLTFIGTGNDKENIQNLVKISNLTDKIFFKDETTQEQLAEYLRAADYALASTSFNKKYPFLFMIGRPTKIFEALLCGTPVIAIGGSSTKLFEEEFPGYVTVFEEGNLEGIVKFIQNVTKTSMNKRLDLAKKAAELYDFKNISEKYYETLKKL